MEGGHYRVANPSSPAKPPPSVTKVLEDRPEYSPCSADESSVEYPRVLSRRPEPCRVPREGERERAIKPGEVPLPFPQKGRRFALFRLCVCVVWCGAARCDWRLRLFCRTERKAMLNKDHGRGFTFCVLRRHFSGPWSSSREQLPVRVMLLLL